MDDSKQSDSSATHSPLQAAAVQYCGYGWRITPTQGKAPCNGKGWQDKATNDAGEALTLLEETTADGVGVLLRASGIIDLDADSPEAEQAIQTLFGGQVPQTPTFRSARGLHRLFQWRDGWQSLATKAKVMAGPIEIRGIGEKAAQTVFPPSGGREWIVSPANCPLAVLDDSIVNELVRMASKAVKAAASTTLAPVDPIATAGRLDVRRWLDRVGAVLLEVDRTTDGTKKWFVQCPGVDRHTTGNKTRDCVVTQEPSGRMGGWCFHSSCGMGNWQALSHALGRPTADEWGYNESDPHWAAIAERLMAGDADDVAHCDNQNAIVEAGIPASTNHPAMVEGLNNSSMLGDQDDEQTSISPPDETNNLPDELLYPPGFLGEFVRYTLSKAKAPQPELALGAALTTLGTLCGHKITDELNTRTNLYVMALAHTGEGKDDPAEVATELLLRTSNCFAVPSGISSAAAVLSVLQNHPVALLALDEIGNLLGFGKGDKSTLYSKMSPVLKRLYTSSTKLFIEAYAGSRKKPTDNWVTIDQPCLSIYGSSTPKTFWQSAMSEEDIEGGLAGRFLVFQGRILETSNRFAKQIEMPNELLEVAKKWFAYTPSENAMLSPCPRVVLYSPDAQQRMQEFFDSVKQQVNKQRNTIAEPIWRRATEKATKLALLAAASRAVEGPESVSVNEDDVQWAAAMVRWCVNNLLVGAEKFMAATRYERDRKKMLAVIVDAKTAGVTTSRLHQAGRTIPFRDRMLIIEDLQVANEIIAIKVDPTSKGGRTGFRWYASQYRPRAPK